MSIPKGFRVEDVTFKNARRQSEIESELEGEDLQVGDVQIPTSLTPEQVKEYFLLKSQNVSEKESRVFLQAVKMIDELLETRKKLFNLEFKIVEEKEDDGTMQSVEDYVSGEVNE